MGHAAPRRGHVVVCGLGALGLRVIEALASSAVAVVVVDADPEPALVAAVECLGAEVIAADPRSAEVLSVAGLPWARSVVSVQEGDLANLETALVVRRLRPDARIIVQMANTAVGSAVGELLHSGAALDVAALSAPSLVQACLGGAPLEVALGGVRFAVTETVVTQPGTLRSTFGDLVPIGVVGADGVTSLCPGRDLAVDPGDRVTVLGTPAEVAGALAGHRATLAGVEEAAPTRLDAVGLALRSVAGSAGRRVAAVVAAVVVLVAVSSVVLHLGYQQPGGGRLSLLDAAYFTVETISTVGFGDYSFAGQPAWLRAYAIVLIVLGGVVIAALFALLTDLLISRRVAEALGQRRLTRLRGHVVVVGLGSVGVRVVEELLRHGRRVVVIERDQENRNLRAARRLGVPIVAGDATSAATLGQANVAAASAVAVLTSDDLTNLETALSLRSYLAAVGADIPVPLRIFDRDLGRIIEESFGFRAVRSPSALAALWFVGAALGLDIVSTVTVDQELLLVARLTVAPAGGLAGLAMQDLSARIRVVALQRAGRSDLEHPPRRSTRFEPGDQAYLIGPYDELITVLRRDAEGSADA